MKNCFLSGTLKALTNVNAILGRPTLKDVERQFRNGSFREPKKCHNNAEITQNKLKDQDNVKKNVRSTRMDSNEQTKKYCSVRKEFIEDCSEETVRENIPSNMDAILESFKMTFNTLTESVSLGLISVTVRISFLFSVLCVFLNDVK